MARQQDNSKIRLLDRVGITFSPSSSQTGDYYIACHQQAFLLTAYRAEGQSTSLEEGVATRYFWKTGKEGTRELAPSNKRGEVLRKAEQQEKQAVTGGAVPEHSG